MTRKERVIKATAHQQPDEVPWSIGVTAHAQAALAHYVGDPRLAEGDYCIVLTRFGFAP